MAVCFLADRPYGCSRDGVGAIFKAIERKRARDGIAHRAENGAPVVGTWHANERKRL